MPAEVNKPIVHYSWLRGAHVGYPAHLTPIDHPNHIEGHDVSNTRMVSTSKVIAYDEITGRIETQNTIYMPEQSRASA